MVKFILELCVHDKLIQSCPTLCNPVDCSPPGSSIRFSRQTSWRGLQSLPPGDLLTQGSNPHLMSPAMAGEFFTNSATWEAPECFYMQTKDTSNANWVKFKPLLIPIEVLAFSQKHLACVGVIMTPYRIRKR